MFLTFDLKILITQFCKEVEIFIEIKSVWNSLKIFALEQKVCSKIGKWDFFCPKAKIFSGKSYFCIEKILSAQPFIWFSYQNIQGWKKPFALLDPAAAGWDVNEDSGIWVLKITFESTNVLKGKCKQNLYVFSVTFFLSSYEYGCLWT